MDPLVLLLLVLLATALVACVALALRLATVSRRVKRVPGPRVAPSAPDPDGLEAFLTLEPLDLGVLRLGADGIVVAANPAAHAILGRPPGALLRSRLLEAVLDPAIERLATAPASDLPLRAEVPRPRGGALTVAVAAAPSGGRWLLLRDASELARLRRIRTEFVDNLSHELRTPVTTIGLLAESVALEADAEGHGLPDRVRERIGRIEVETGHLAQMVGELLDLARAERGEAIGTPEPLDLATIVAAVVERMRPLAERSGIDLSLAAPDPATIPIRGDAERLQQVLVNLVHNAVKFSEPGGTVVVSAAVRDGEAVATVADRGMGIPLADQPRIFERFYKADRARPRGRGTGLGLSIARHLVEAHGGRIELESTLGAGSTFTVFLPLATDVPGSPTLD